MIDKKCNREIIDGMEVFFPDTDDWSDIFKDGHYCGRKTDITVRKKYVEWVLQRPDFRAGLVQYSSIKSLMLMTFYLLDGRSQPIEFETITCDQCQTTYFSANPAVSGLYSSDPLVVKARKRAWALPELPCPKCQGKLPRSAIWLEEKAEGDLGYRAK